MAMLPSEGLSVLFAILVLGPSPSARRIRLGSTPPNLAGARFHESNCPASRRTGAWHGVLPPLFQVPPEPPIGAEGRSVVPSNQSQGVRGCGRDQFLEDLL